MYSLQPFLDGFFVGCNKMLIISRHYLAAITYAFVTQCQIYSLERAPRLSLYFFIHLSRKQPYLANSQNHKAEQ